MKVFTGHKGAAPIAPDYAMLRAALMAAQAATPTARANSACEPADFDPHAALHALFASRADLDAPAAALGYRFSTDAPEPEDGA